MSTPALSPTLGLAASGSTPLPILKRAISSFPPWSVAATSFSPSARGGAAPALAREIRRRLEEQFDEDFGRWAALLAELRPSVLQGVRDAERRRLLFEDWARWPWLERLRRDGVEAVRAEWLRQLREAGDEPPHPL